MYQVTVKGKTLEELKCAVADIHEELSNGATVVRGMERDLSSTIVEETSKPIDEALKTAEVSTQIPTSPVNSVPEGVEVDSEGIPWDKRIHSSSKKQMKNGMWRLKRGVEDNFVAEIKAELKQSLQFAANPPSIPAAPINEATPVVEQQVEESVPFNMNEQPTLTVPTETPATPVNTQPVAPTVPTMNSGHSLETFTQNFPLVMSSLISEGKLTQEYVNQLKAYFKVNEIWEVTDQQKGEIFNNFVQTGIVQQAG